MRALTLILSGLLLIPNILYAKENSTSLNAYQPFPGWFTGLKVGGNSHTETNLDGGGQYNETRYRVQASQSYFWDPQNSITLALNYKSADYHFSGSSNGLVGISPWGHINSWGISMPIRKELKGHWSGFLLPYVRSSGESGATFKDSLTAGMIAAASYRFSQNLSIGSGFVIGSQLEDSLSFFPLLLVKWNISDQLDFNLGNGSEAIQAPGLSLSYKVNKKWRYTLGGYYEKSRFRLNNSGYNAGGVGESKAFPLLASVIYNLNPGTKVMLVTGLKLAQELSLDNSEGDTLYSESADTSLTAGISFSLRL